MRYKILTLIPEDEPASYHVIDEVFNIEVSITDSLEEAQAYREKRLTLDNQKSVL